MRQWLAAALALTVAACAAPSRPTLGAAPDMSAPLDARIFPPYYGSAPVQLSKPAYVALFEVIPGRGAALLYPQAGNGFQQVTESWVPIRYSASRWLYTTDMQGRGGYVNTHFSSGYDTYRGYDAYGFARPRYLFLVASEAPLAIEQFQEDAASVRRYLGAAMYSAYEPYEVMERLAYAMLPFAPSDSWVMDVYVDWGYDWGYGHGPGMTAAQASYWPVVCGQGPNAYVTYARYVAGWGFAMPSCVGASVVGPPGTPGLPRPPVDSVAVPPGEGRDRTTTPDENGRRRAGAAAPVQSITEADDARAVRQRVTALREDASRPGFERGLTDRLRQDVRERQRTAVSRGYRQPAHLLGSEPPRIAPGDVAGQERAARSRAGGDPGYRPGTLGGSTQATSRARGSSGSSAGSSGGARARTEPARERSAPSPSPSASPSSTPSSTPTSEPSGGSSGGRSRTTPPPG